MVGNIPISEKIGTSRDKTWISRDRDSLSLFCCCSSQFFFSIHEPVLSKFEPILSLILFVCPCLSPFVPCNHGPHPSILGAEVCCLLFFHILDYLFFHFLLLCCHPFLSSVLPAFQITAVQLVYNPFIVWLLEPSEKWH